MVGLSSSSKAYLGEVVKFFDLLSKWMLSVKRESKRAILQTMQRLPGSVSTRLKPPGFEPDFWGFV